MLMKAQLEIGLAITEHTNRLMERFRRPVNRDSARLRQEVVLHLRPRLREIIRFQEWCNGEDE